MEALRGAGAILKAEDHHYVRLERIHVNEASRADLPAFDGIVRHREYYGLYIKYAIDLGPQQVKVIEKNDGMNIHKPGDAVTVHIHPKDVMSYPAAGS